VWDNGIERVSADLRGWLREVALHNTDWTPVHFEHQFSSIAITDRHLLQGRIDLVEEHADGTLRITDHKTGRPPSDDEVKQTGGAEFLQPVLYAMAANEDFKVSVREARLFYATLRGSYKVLPVTPDEEARQNATDVLDTIDAALRNGELPAAPRKEACKRCDYVQVCGPYEEQRVALKPPRKDLVRIREIR
jgi:CRISPR/Cas system-associated exonuclease Cas4 (RecB family)